MKEEFFGEGLIKPEIIKPEIEKPEEEKVVEKLKFAEGVIERLDEKQAQIKLEDGQTINWPKEKLPQSCQEGEKVKLSLLSKEELAKEILNTIFNPLEKNE